MTANPSIDVDTPVALPAGFTMRPATMDDLTSVVALLNIWSLDMYGREESELDDVRQGWTMPDFSIHGSIRLVHTVDGQLVGYIRVWDVMNPPVHPWISGYVHPEYKGQGIGTAMLEWAEQRSLQAVDRCPPDVRVAYRTGCKKGDTASEQLFADHDLVSNREFYEMLIVMEEAPPEPILPEGFSIRSYQHPDEMDAVIRADEDAFRDHYGFVERPFEESKKLWKHWIEEDKEFEAELWFLAIEDATQEIAGVCLCRRRSWEDADTAYVDSLAVRRPYRKRGLGMALLQHSFGVFWNRGSERVGLGVDASSITGAVKLYERAGMHIDRQFTDYEKELRPGKEISMVSAGD